jgi:hypothetical protein
MILRGRYMITAALKLRQSQYCRPNNTPDASPSPVQQAPTCFRQAATAAIGGQLEALQLNASRFGRAKERRKLELEPFQLFELLSMYRLVRKEAERGYCACGRR